jgi:hypothetical protein
MVRVSAQRFFILAFLLAALPVTAQFGPEFERILLPVAAVDTPGAFGSLWRTEFWCRNDGDTPVAVVPLAQSETSLLPHVDTQPPIFLASRGFPPGQFIYVRRIESAKLRFNLRIRDVSRAVETWGAEIPVVRDGEFFSGSLTLLNVPTGSRFRQTLRIYALSATPAVVHMRVVPLRSTRPLGEEDIELAPGDSVGYVPAFRQISLTERFPQLASGQPVRIELQAAAPDLELWAFVTVTNNDTQEVTTVTPQ